MEPSDEVVKWRTVATAVYNGALEGFDSDKTFACTDDIIQYLYTYQNKKLSAGSDTDFYYHPEKLMHGPVSLNKFFVDHNGSCILCWNITMTAIGGSFRAEATARRITPISVRARLEHIAVMHTPYFVMLFAELAQSKWYVFHKTAVARSSIASYVFGQLNKNSSRFDQGESPDRFLKLWWRLQAKRSSRTLTVSIPWYLQLQTDDDDNNRWNIRNDIFIGRKPEPLYTFLKKQCICHELSHTAARTSDVDVTTKMTKWPRGHVSTLSLRVMLPKRHIEDILHSAVKAYEDRQAMCWPRSLAAQMMNWEHMACSKMLAPRLDCLVLEAANEVNKDKAVMMHVVTTLDSQWQTMDSWMASVRVKSLNPDQLTSHINKVLLGVMGSLRDMCLANNRPPRRVYVEHKLATVFFVHCETGDVLSLLPFISLSKMYRSSNDEQDESRFRKACATLAMHILYSPEGNDNVSDEQERLLHWWNCEEPYLGASSVESLNLRDRVLLDTWTFCRTGLVRPDKWATLRPDTAGHRDMSEVDVLDVWLGEDSRPHKALKAKLLALGFTQPLSVSVIELLKECEASVFRDSDGFTMPYPEVHQRLVSAVTATTQRTVSTASDSRTSLKGSRNVHKDKRPKDRPDPHMADRKHHVTPGISVRNLGEQCRQVYDEHSVSSSGISTVSENHPQSVSESLPESCMCNASQIHLASAIEPQIYATNLCFTQNTYAFGAFMENVEEPDPFPTLGKSLLDNKETCQGLNTSRTQTGALCFANTQDDSMHSGSDMTAMLLFDLYKDRFNDPEHLQRSIRESVDNVNIHSGYWALQWPQPQPQPTVPPQVNQVVEVTDPDMLLQMSDIQLSYLDWAQGVVAVADPVMEPVAMVGPVHVNEGVTLVPLETSLRRKRNWKTRGLTSKELKDIDYQPCRAIVYEICDNIVQNNGSTILCSSPEDPRPVTNSCTGLTRPLDKAWEIPHNLSIALPTVDRRKGTWHVGIEISVKGKVRPGNLGYPENFGHNRNIPCSTLSWQSSRQTYRTVNLAKPPCHGFRHVELITDNIPVSKRSDTIKLLLVKVENPKCLGLVNTMTNAPGLLVHRVFYDDVNIIEDILDMHTSLQLHPFIARTFALHLLEQPYKRSGVSVFVGEAVGDWNLSCLHERTFADQDNATLAYHVLQCLLRAQIVALRVLGFAMKWLQPARIWRWRDGFRVDLIGCLVDTMHMWNNPDSPQSGSGAILRTLDQLGLLTCLPHHVMLPLIAGRVTDTEEALQNIYNLCHFTDQDTSVHSNLDTILGYDQYTHLKLETKSFILEPYGPFNIQIHHQFFQWNRAIVVEPILDRTLSPLATVIGYQCKRERQKRAKRVPHSGSLVSQKGTSGVE